MKKNSRQSCFPEEFDINDVGQQMGDTAACQEAFMFVSAKHVCKSRSFGLLSENMPVSENLCCNTNENEELRTGAGEGNELKDVVVRPREVEDARDEVMLLNNESKIRESKSCICVLQDADRRNDHVDKLLLSANTTSKEKEKIARQCFVGISGFLVTAGLLISEDSSNRSSGRAAADLSVCSENITRKPQDCKHNVSISCDKCGKNVQSHDLWFPPQGNNCKHESMKCQHNYKKHTMGSNMLPQFLSCSRKEFLQLHTQQENQLLPTKTQSDAILSTQHSPALEQVDAHHKQAGVLMTTVCDTYKTEHGFVHSTQSACYLCNEEVPGVYSSINNLQMNITARDEIMDSCIISSSSSTADAVLTKSDKPERCPHCKYVNMKRYSLLDGDTTKVKEHEQLGKEETLKNKLDKQEITVDIVEDHKVHAVSISEADSVLKRTEIEESNGERLIRKDKSAICILEKVYEGQDELDKMLHNTKSTPKDQYGVASEQCDGPISGGYYTSDRSLESIRNIPSCCRLSKLNLETISKEHSMLEEIVAMFSSQDLYKVLDGRVISDFKNYFSLVTLLISANRNKSGNSGYSPTQYPPGAGNTRKKCKKPDPTMHIDEGNQSQKLQSCLEKVRLACALHSTIGHMRKRADHHAAVMAYEQSIKDLETSMKNFLELNVGNNTKDKSLYQMHPLEIDNPQRRTRKGAKHQRGQNALLRSETFVIEDPYSHSGSPTLESKRGITDLCVQKVYNQQGKMCVNGIDVGNDEETIIFSSDSAHSVCFSPDLLSADNLFPISPVSPKRSYFHRSKASKASRHSSLDSWNADSERKWASEGRYESKSHDSDFDTSECLSLPVGSNKQTHRSLDLAASHEKSCFDKIGERLQSNNKEATLRRKFSYVNISGSTFSDVRVLNDELEDKARPQHSAGNTYLCTSLRLPKVPARSQSLNDGNTMSQKDKSDTEPSVSNTHSEVKKHITSISDVYLPICDPFSSVKTVIKESCYPIHKRNIIQEFPSLRSLTQRDLSMKDIQDTAVINTSKMSLCPAVYKDVNSCTGKHDTYSNLQEKLDSVNDTCRQEYHTSSQEQACIERASCFFNDSASVQMKSSQDCSSHISAGSHKKWRLPNISRKNTFLQFYSDMFPSKTDWSGSDEDTNDDLQVDLSLSDNMYHHKSGVNTKLDELKRYAQRRKKNRTLFHKRASTNTPSWVDNADNVHYLNNTSFTLDTKKTISSVKHGCLKGAHTVYPNEQFTAERDKTVTGERECTNLSLKESQNIQELISISQPVDTVNKEEASKLHKHIHTQNEKHLDVVENGNCETTNNDRLNTTENKNNARSKNTLTKMVEKMSRGPSFQARYIAASSSLSTRIGENVCPASQSCKESKSDSGFKSNHFKRKFTASSSTCCAHSMSQSHETGFVSGVFATPTQTSTQCEDTGFVSGVFATPTQTSTQCEETGFVSGVFATPTQTSTQWEETGFVSGVFATLTQTSTRCEEASDLSVSDLSSNILASTSTTTRHSCSQEHQSSDAVSTLVLSKSSSGTFINQSCSDLQTSEVTFHDSERDDDNDTRACSKKMNETEQRVIEISVSQPRVIQLPYPFCFVSLKDEKQFVYQGKEDIPNDHNRSEDVKQQNDDPSATCHTGETEAETSKMFSVRSPPKCLYSNKQVNYSYLNSMSANPVILNDKEIRCSDDVDGKGTCPFSIVGDDLDSSSQDENDTADFPESAAKRKEKHALNIDSSNDIQFKDGSKSSISRHEDEHAVKHLQRTRKHNQCVPLSITTKCQHTINDPLTNCSQITLDRRGDCKNRRRSTTGIQSLHTDLWESQESRSQSPGSQKESEIIKHLSDKVKYLETMLEFTHFPYYSFQHKNQNIDNTKDSVLSMQPHNLQCVATENLDQTQMTSVTRHSSKLHPGCCRQTSEPCNPENPESCHLQTPCRCVHNACSRYPLDYHRAESKIAGRTEATPCESTACQTMEDYESTNDTRLRPCTLVDSSTQYDADLPEEGAGDISKLLRTQMTQMHADIQAMKHNALLGSFQSLRELVSDQKRELGEMNSKMETIALSLEDRQDGRTKKGEDHDKTKARLVELTSQRDAEKMFHKITRQALRSLERDHDRLRQEFFHANCRRFGQGESLVQNRVWYHLNGDDTACHHNTNHSNIRRYYPGLEKVTSRRHGQEKTPSKCHRHTTDCKH